MSRLLSVSSISMAAWMLAAAALPAEAQDALRQQYMRKLAAMTSYAKLSQFILEAHAIESQGNPSGDVRVHFTLEADSTYAFGAVCSDGCEAFSLRVFDEHVRLVGEGWGGGLLLMRPKATGPYQIRLDILACRAPKCAAAIAFFKQIPAPASPRHSAVRGP